MTTTIAELKKLYPDIEPETIEGVFEDCNGVKAECVEQLDSLLMPTMGSQQESWPEPDEVFATGEEARRLKLQASANVNMKDAEERIQKQMAQLHEFYQEVEKQKKLGPQSCRGMSEKELMKSMSGLSGHSRQCFQTMLDRERQHCGEFVVFYHSYSYAELMYECQAVIAQTLYGLPEDFAPLPRLLKGPFTGKPHLQVLLKEFNQLCGQDHDPNFRNVAISTSVSLLGNGSEAPPHSVFQMGYSCSDLSFTGIMTTLFTDLGANTEGAAKLVKRVAEVGSKWGLHGNMYESSVSQTTNNSAPGHMIQIFIRTDLVDDLAYGSHAYGVYNAEWNPPSKYLTGKTHPTGQGRVFVHPSAFMDWKKVKVYHYAANETFHTKRREFLRDLRQALLPLYDTPQKAIRAMYGIEGQR
eukprot:PhF_6_TR40242/c0_g1_i6/m.59860